MNILIAEDNLLSQKLLQASLEKAGHRVLAACNGAQALQMKSHWPSRLIISDWEMPELNGLELCRHIRAELDGNYTYFILLTARDGRDNKLEALSAGVDDFVTKPFDQAELAAKLHNVEKMLAVESRELTIFALAKLAESRDPETGAHLERVRSYTRLLASELVVLGKYAGIVDAEYVRMIYQTSPLHDIGKVAIPDCVLLKPGRLSDREFNIMKSHTTLGAQTLRAALDSHPGALFLDMASEIALTHHERFDGSGYPSGLKGTNIPLSGRIMAIADVYDALTSRRVYKAAFDEVVAGSLIREGAGSHFDPELVEVFSQVEDRFAKVREMYSEREKEYSSVLY